MRRDRLGPAICVPLDSGASIGSRGRRARGCGARAGAAPTPNLVLSSRAAVLVLSCCHLASGVLQKSWCQRCLPRAVSGAVTWVSSARRRPRRPRRHLPPRRGPTPNPLASTLPVSTTPTARPGRRVRASTTRATGAGPPRPARRAPPTRTRRGRTPRPHPRRTRGRRAPCDSPSAWTAGAPARRASSSATTTTNTWDDASCATGAPTQTRSGSRARSARCSTRSTAPSTTR